MVCPDVREQHTVPWDRRRVRRLAEHTDESTVRSEQYAALCDQDFFLARYEVMAVGMLCDRSRSMSWSVPP
jgi:hypothetical protein